MAKYRILIVEDEFLVAADIEESLINLGYEVQGCVPSGPGALAEVERSLPDVILMDIRLKGQMTGIEAAKLILQKHDVPIIYLTANADMGTIDQAKLSLPYGYIIKPFTEKDLQTNIEIARFKFESDIQMKMESDQFNTFFKPADSAGGQIFLDGEQDEIIRQHPDNIYFIEQEDTMCKVYLRDYSIHVKASLENLLVMLPQDTFVRVNQNCIVNANKVFLAKYPEVIIKDRMVVITVEEVYSHAFKTHFQDKQ